MRKRYELFDEAYVIDYRNKKACSITIVSIKKNDRGEYTYNGYEDYQLYKTKEECEKFMKLQGVKDDN